MTTRTVEQGEDWRDAGEGVAVEHPGWCHAEECEVDRDAVFHASAPIEVVPVWMADAVEHGATALVALTRADALEPAPGGGREQCTGETTVTVSFVVEQNGRRRAVEVGWADLTPGTARRLADALARTAARAEADPCAAPRGRALQGVGA